MKKHDPAINPLLTYPQMAQRLNVCLNSARAIAEEEQLVRVKVGKRGVRITSESLEAYIARQTTGK